MSELHYDEVFNDADGAVAEDLGEALGDAPAEEDELFRDLGMVDPYTGEPIESRGDFLRWKERFLADSAARKEQSARMALPDPMAHDLEDAALMARINEAVGGELEKIRQWDTAVATLEDIAAAETLPAVYEKVMKGYSLSDAFYLVNADAIQKEAVRRAEEAADRRFRSKEHLRAVAPRGGGEVRIPAEVMAEFKRILPEADLESIRKFYRKDKGRRAK